jgi:hypothetical protein
METKINLDRLIVDWKIKKPGKNQQDAVFYTDMGNIADITLTVDGLDWTIKAYCDGITRIRDHKQDSVYTRGEYLIWAGYDTDEKLSAAIEAEELEVINNSWFDFYTMDGEHLDYVTHEIDEMLEGAKALLETIISDGSYFNYLS